MRIFLCQADSYCYIHTLVCKKISFLYYGLYSVERVHSAYWEYELILFLLEFATFQKFTKD